MKPTTKTTTKIEPRHRHILATPLVDVLSVTINTLPGLFKLSPTLEIFGHIQVINTRLGADSQAISLFHRDESKPHSTCVGIPLPLSPSSPILPSKYTHLQVFLYDKKSRSRVAHGHIVLDIKSDTYEESRSVSFLGERGTLACVDYFVFQYAVAATVDVLFFSKDDNFDLLTKENKEDEDENNLLRKQGYDKIDVINYSRSDSEDGVVADVFGSVSVFSTVKNGTSKRRTRRISLFKKKYPEQAVCVKSGDFIKLSRSLVSVPAYSSSLTVVVNLSLGNTGTPLLSGNLEFHPEHESTFKKDLHGDHGRVRVRVTWDHAYDQQLYHEKKQEYQDVKPRWSPEIIEVFSVAAHSKDSKPFSFYGTVDVKDRDELCIYSKDKSSCPQVCPLGGAILPLKGPCSRSIRTTSQFWLRVHLKDGTTGGEFSDGYAAWDDHMLSFWNDRRLCSVIRGELGFVAVHYTSFRDAISAAVSVKLYGEQVRGGYVYGKIFARYSTYEYSTSYDEKYFQNILFDRHSEDDGLQPAVECGSYVPLLKSVVCFPRDSFLVVEVDLAVASQPSIDGKIPQGATLLKGSLELKPDQCLQKLAAETFRIDVSMSFLPWEDAFKLLS